MVNTGRGEIGTRISFRTPFEAIRKEEGKSVFGGGEEGRKGGSNKSQDPDTRVLGNVQ